MTIMADVAAEVQEKRLCTEDDLAPNFPNYSRQQIRKALQNGARRGLVKVVKRGRYRGPGGVIHAIWGAPDVPDAASYFPQQKKERVLVASVFELGTPRPADAWPKPWLGTIHRPLGDWNSAEEMTA